MFLNQGCVRTRSKVSLFVGSLIKSPVIRSLAEFEIVSQTGKSNSSGPYKVIFIVSSYVSQSKGSEPLSKA